MQSGFDGQTALSAAAANGHSECVLLLLDAGVDQNAIEEVRIARCFYVGWLAMFCARCFSRTYVHCCELVPKFSVVGFVHP
jgi:hypothetical protein